MEIRRFADADRATVIALWETAGLIRSWNDPDRDIDRKLAHDPDGFLVGEIDGHVVASAMYGYDGHRGSVFYLAVHPDRHREGHGHGADRRGQPLARLHGLCRIVE